MRASCACSALDGPFRPFYPSKVCASHQRRHAHPHRSRPFRLCVSSTIVFFFPPIFVATNCSTSSMMRSPGGAPPQDADWQLEWRWGAAHPWMRPKGAPASPSTSETSSVAAPSSPRPSCYSPSSLTPSSCSSASSASPCCCNTSSSSSSLDSSRLPSGPSLFPPSDASCACPSSSVNPPQDASTGEKARSIPAGAAASSATAIAASSWPQFFPFCSLFRGAQIRGTHAPAQAEVTANVNPQATTADTSAPSTRVAGAGPATAPAATLPASSAPAAAARATDLLPESGAKTAAARPVLSTNEAGAEEVRWGLQDGVRKTRVPVVSVAGALPASGQLPREAASTTTDESDRFPEREAAADQKTERKSEVVETEVEAVAGAAAPSDLSGRTVSAAAPATSAGVATVDEKRDQQQLKKPARESPGGVRQQLQLFGDQTLNFLQRQQMALWSFFAFRDWRVKTLVHALSAMGEPVNLVVVNCTPPPPAVVSSSSVASYLTNASECSPDSSSPSLSHSCLSSALPISSPVAMSLSKLSAAPGPCVSTATDAGRPLGRREAAVTETAETEEPVAETQLAFLPSVSPVMGEDVVRGGYSPLYHTIWLCGNRLWSPFELRRVLLHELVHAFDFARANLSPNNCRHVACTEIRAYNLSGQCGWWRTRSYDIEQFNTVQTLLPRQGTDAGSLGLGHQQQKGAPANDSGQWQQTKRNRCVTHGALNSLRQHRHCQVPGVAEDAVRDVFTRCIRDTWPFLVPPERDSRWRPSRMWRPEAAEFLKK